METFYIYAISKWFDYKGNVEQVIDTSEAIVPEEEAITEVLVSEKTIDTFDGILAEEEEWTEDILEEVDKVARALVEKKKKLRHEESQGNVEQLIDPVPAGEMLEEASVTKFQDVRRHWWRDIHNQKIQISYVKPV